MTTATDDPRLRAAYETCARFARHHYENFPVASLLLPSAMRPHVAALYAFARTADDFADEADLLPGERLALLDAWAQRLALAAAGDGERVPPSRAGLPPETDAVFLALGNTIRQYGLAVSLFEDLLSAFRQDVTTKRYSTWGEVLDYCHRSANPVGRLVLAIGGYRDERLNRASDAVCTALQLTNFWQDLERDWTNGRLYLPLDECRREGADFEDLDRGRLSAAWTRVVRAAGERTAALFEAGRPVCDGVRGRLRLELRLTWLGGRRILERLDDCGYDVFVKRPTLGAVDLPGLLWQTITWKHRAQEPGFTA